MYSTIPPAAVAASAAVSAVEAVTSATAAAIGSETLFLYFCFFLILDQAGMPESEITLQACPFLLFFQETLANRKCYVTM